LGARQATDLAREAEVAARAAERELTRLSELSKAGVAPDRELEQGAAAAETRRIAASRLGTAAEQVPRQQALRERESLVRLQRLRLELATLEAERERRRAEVERLEYEVERRRVRAPVSGRVGEVAELHPGSVIDAGAELGSIVPSGKFVVVAHYPADVALGRIRSGQSAELRLDGFPWSEFGTVSSTVTHVAQEVRDGAVRVESTLAVRSSFRGRLEHGMPGMLEVTLERVTPFRLVLRTAGAWLTVQP
jgi:membrane fusion protein (multidrug efflux system)